MFNIRLPRLTAFIHALLLSLLLMPLAQADSYPQRPIRVIVASTAGSAPDILARILGQELSSRLGQTLVVDNKPGAGGVIGIEQLAKSAPDGYTLGIGHDGTMAINTVLYPTLSYKPAEDFAPIGAIALNEFVLIAHPSTNVKSFADFVAYAKANSGKASYASAGNGTPNHVFMEQVLAAIDAKMLHVPYRGGAAAVTDVAAGQVGFMLAGVAPALPQIKSGRVNAVAVVQAKRASVLPDVPTVGESIPGFSLKTWFGLFAPAKTSPEIVNRLNKELREVLALPTVREKLEQQGMQIYAGSPAELGAMVRDDIKRYQELAKTIKLQND